MQAQETVHAGAQRFRHHLARALLVEAVDLDPVEAGQRPHLARAFAQEGGEAVGLAHPRDHGAHHGGGFHLLGHRGLGLDHHLARRKNAPPHRTAGRPASARRPNSRSTASSPRNRVTRLRMACTAFSLNRLDQRPAQRRIRREADELRCRLAEARATSQSAVTVTRKPKAWILPST